MKLYLLILCNTASCFACWGGSATPPPIVKKKKGMLDFENQKHWGGWSHPSGAEKAWDEWLKQSKANAKKGGYLDPNNPGKAYGHDVPGWPRDWAGLGPPFEGLGPPPWAYVPTNTGKPKFCYDEPLYGSCHDEITRFGYNPYADECHEFVYSGCGGNRNNFVDQLRCEQACVNPPVSGCDPDSGIPIDNLIPA